MCLSTPKTNPWPAKCPRTSRAVFLHWLVYTGIDDMVALWKTFSHLPGLERGCSGTGKEGKAAGAQPGPLPGSKAAAQGHAWCSRVGECRAWWQERIFLEVQQSSEGSVKKWVVHLTLAAYWAFFGLLCLVWSPDTFLIYVWALKSHTPAWFWFYSSWSFCFG